MEKSKRTAKKKPGVVLIGAGIMSATLGLLLKELEPDVNIEIFERLDKVAAESSDAWNNAGTGHSAFCELNYTTEKEDGSIDIGKAIKIAESFEVSKEFWSFLIEQNLIRLPDSFICKIPHISFVWGARNVSFLKKRYETMSQCHLFDGMEYSEDPDVLRKWMPLVLEHRDKGEKVAATRMDIGTDVNFGALTRSIFDRLQEMPGVRLHFDHEVRDLDQNKDGSWCVKLKNIQSGSRKQLKAKFVFIGAGGGALPVLMKSGIPESKGFGGFPVSGQWLKCNNPEVIHQHHAKVYGKAAVGSPPMSVPHLDTRVIKGKQELLFGPYAGFTTKFLKNGSVLDLVKSIRLTNIIPMVAAGLHNLPLTKYLIDQSTQSPEDRLRALKEYYPDAKLDDWDLEIAGQRVQVIKKDEEHTGVLEFGTEVVSAADGSIAALLGASPGASTAVSIMIELLNKCFKSEMKSIEWQEKMKLMIPSFGKELGRDRELAMTTRKRTAKILKLTD